MNPSVASVAGGESVRLEKPRVRVLIHNDPSDPDRYLRFFGTVIGGIDPNDNQLKWAAVTQGTTLPNGLYFVPPVGGAVAEEADSMPARSESGLSSSSMLLEFPRIGLQTEGSGTTWLVYEFDSSGRAVSDGGLNRVVISTGFYRESGSSGTVYFTNQYAVTGFAILPSGTLALYQDPDDIKASE